MSLADDLAKLDDLRARGALSDEEFARAKARLLDAPSLPPAVSAVNTLRRSRDDRWLGGVCGGLGRLTAVDSWVWRLIFVLLVACAGTGVLLYLVMWVLVPVDAAPGPVAAAGHG